MAQKKKSSVLPIIITILIVLLVAVGLYVWLAPVQEPQEDDIITLNLSDIIDIEDLDEEVDYNEDVDTALNLTNVSNVSNLKIAATFKEGDLIALRQNIAQSPDGSQIKYPYSKPLDSNGQWQTQIGDAGIYSFTITADDGRLKTIRNVVVEVKAVNRAPVISSFSDITVNEGDKILLSPVITDHESDNISVEYSGWMRGNTYKTTFEDEGAHYVTLSAKDGLHTVNKTITITVKNVNRPPMLENLAPITIEEEQSFTAKPVFYDLDKGQQLKITYTKPLSQKGEWTPKIGDAGKYDISITVSDGESDVTKPLQIIVTEKNLAPVITNFSDVSVDENSTLVLMPVVSDKNNDKLTLTFSGWMNSSTKDVKFGDAGTHDVTLTVSDGKLSTSETITVTVNKVYRAPVFVDDSDLFVK